MDANKRIDALEEFFVDLSRKVDVMVDFMGKMASAQDQTNLRLDQLITRVERFEDSSNRNFDKLEDRLIGLEKHSENQEKHLGNLDKRAERQGKHQTQTNQELSHLNKSVVKIEGNLQDLSTKVDRLLKLEDRVAALDKAVFK